MTILCGTDFTEPAAKAVRGAAAVAARLREELLLVHVADFPGAEAILRERAGETAGKIETFFDDERQRLRARLDREVESLKEFGVAVRAELLTGPSDEALVARAAKEHARLIVVGALGRRQGSLWRLGSTADRVAQTSPAPVLVMRDARPFEEWARGARPLSIVAGVDATPTSDAALRMIAVLEAAGPCRVLCAHVYWPPEAKERLHVGGGLPIGTGHPEVERALEGDLRSRIAGLRAGRPFEMRLLGGLGRTADHLAQIAAEEKADLLVVGTHQRAGLPRAWHGSVSHGVLDVAPMSVVCVPAGPPT